MTDNNHGIQKLNDFQHARQKTEMYLGSRSPHEQEVLIYSSAMKPELKTITWVPALYTSFREALDNAIDEVVGHNHGNQISVDFNPETLEISIADNGNGIPIDKDKTFGTYLATMVLTETKSGRNFGDRGTVAGTNGLGISVVNFCSEYFIAEIHRDNKKFVQEFREGNILDQLEINKPKITQNPSGKTGTKITFKPSADVFPVMLLPEEFIRSRVIDVALANPHVRVIYNGDRIKTTPYTEKLIFSDYKPVVIEISEENIKSRFILIPDFLTEGEHFHTLVNNIPAWNGGIHIDMFKRTFYSNFLAVLEKEAKRRKVTPNRTDVVEKVLIFNITEMKAPNFDSQSKTRLIDDWVGKAISKSLTDEDLYKTIIRKNREWVDDIFQRAEDRTNKKDQADTKKAAKNAKRAKVDGLMEASGTDRSKCILFLAEGLSAITGMANVRDPDIHGGLGLRGKVLNVNGEAPKKALDNSTLVNIMNSLGIMIGDKAIRQNMMYGKLFIAADMDPDGANITSLIINFLHTYWPELFDSTEDPFVHVFMTPFIIAEKGKQRKYWYGHDYHNFKPDQYQGWAITRAKGLGTLTKDDWEHALSNPVSIPIIDDGNMKESLDLIFNGGRADERKIWIGL